MLIDENGYLKVTDFGFAKILPNEKRTFTICGTPEYLAPESFCNNKRGYGKSVDIWAFGIFLFEMLAGVPPFQSRDPYSIYQNIIKGVLYIPPHFSDHAGDFLRNVLQVDPCKRFDG